MTARAAERGQPLVMLGVVLAGWIVLRTALWQPPFAELAPVSIRPNAGEAVFATLRGPAPELSASSPPILASAGNGGIAFAGFPAAPLSSQFAIAAAAPAPVGPVPMALRSAAGTA